MQAARSVASRISGTHLFVACATGGLVSGLTGLGGGTVITPILTSLLGYHQHAAHAVSLASMAGSAVVSSAIYLSSGKASVPHAMMLAGTSAVWAAAGAAIAHQIRAGPLRALFLAFLAATSLLALSGFSPPRLRPPGPAAHVAASALAGTAAGMLAGLLGVGGGTVFVPTLVLLGFSQQTAQGTSLLAIVPSSAFAALQYAKAGHLSRGHALASSSAAAVGAAAGSLLAIALPAPALRKVFAAFLLLAAARQAAQLLPTRPRAVRPMSQ